MNPRSTLHPRLAMLAAASTLALLGACASTPPPIEQLAVGKAAVEKASGPALAAARDKINRANIAYANKDYTYARQLAEQAEADATLAEAQARSVRSSSALSEVRESIRQLREEMARK
jgi:hypothetical protein